MPQSTSRFRPPGFLRHSPVDAFEQIAHLPGADRDDAIRRRRPDETAPFKSLGEQAHALTVMPDHLDQVTSAAPKNEEIAAVRVVPQNFLDLQRQAGPALAHIRMARGQPYPCPRRQGRDPRGPDHWPSTARTRRKASASTWRSTRRRRPPDSSISITPPADISVTSPRTGTTTGANTSATSSGAVTASTFGPTTTGMKPGTIGLDRDRNPSACRRHVYKRPVEIPYRRATTAPEEPERASSATIASFCSTLHRRRRSGPVKTSARNPDPVIRALVRVAHQPEK